jgi:hypothetical protein
MALTDFPMPPKGGEDAASDAVISALADFSDDEIIAEAKSRGLSLEEEGSEADEAEEDETAEEPVNTMGGM